MDEQQILTISQKTHGISVGVLKYDFQKIGYPEVLKRAQELKKDSHFLQIIVRKVSKENWGIQYTYAIPVEDLAGVRIWTYLQSTYDQILKDTYAIDLTFTQNDGIEIQWIQQTPFVVAEG